MLYQEKIPQEVLEVCEILIGNGNQAFLVGGSIRDLLIGMTPSDWDITTDASPEVVMNLFKSHCKVIPTGLKHGTVTVINNGINIEITTFRVEEEYKDGRRPSKVSFVRNVEEDLSRRDLTINSIAYDPIRHEIKDPYDGIDDIKRKIIKMVGDPDRRLEEDGLRVIRIFRFASQLGYKIDEKTFEAVPRHFDVFAKVAKERIYVELIKMFKGKYWKEALISAAKCSLLEEIFPQFKDKELNTVLEDINMSRLEITFNVLHNLPENASLLLRIAVLIHQFSAIGKETKRIFPIYNGRIIISCLRILKFTNKQINSIVQILKIHTIPLPYDMLMSDKEKDYKIRKFQYQIGVEYVNDYFDFYQAKADILKVNVEKFNEFLVDFRKRAEKQKPIRIRDLVINGDFIIAFFKINKSISSQREFIGICLDILRERVEIEPHTNKKSNLIGILQSISRIYNQCTDIKSRVMTVSTDHVRKLYTDNKPGYSAWENTHTYKLSIWLIECLLRRKQARYVIFDGTNFNFPSHPNHLGRIFLRFKNFNPMFIQVVATEEEILFNYEERKKEEKSIKKSDAGLDVYYKYKELIEKYPYALNPPKGSNNFMISSRDKDFDLKLNEIVESIKKYDCRLIVLSGNVLSGKSYIARALHKELMKLNR
ncbi:MAG: CCA tRNA nucleotidyltransferase [Candidatus Hodarchaeales archaeon]